MIGNRKSSLLETSRGKERRRQLHDELIESRRKAMHHRKRERVTLRLFFIDQRELDLILWKGKPNWLTTLTLTLGV